MPKKLQRLIIPKIPGTWGSRSPSAPLTERSLGSTDDDNMYVDASSTPEQIETTPLFHENGSSIGPGTPTPLFLDHEWSVSGPSEQVVRATEFCNSVGPFNLLTIVLQLHTGKRAANTTGVAQDMRMEIPRVSLKRRRLGDDG